MFKDEKQLVNIIYHNNKYYIYEPANEKENADNIIDNHLWLIMKYMPKKCMEIK